MLPPDMLQFTFVLQVKQLSQQLFLKDSAMECIRSDNLLNEYVGRGGVNVLDLTATPIQDLGGGRPPTPRYVFSCCRINEIRET